MVLYGVVPECHRSASGMLSECIMSAKMVSLSASGTVLRVCSTCQTCTAKFRSASPRLTLTLFRNTQNH